MRSVAIKTIQPDDADVITGGTEARRRWAWPSSQSQGPVAAKRRTTAPAARSIAIAMGSCSPKGLKLIVLEELEYAQARGAENLCRIDRLRRRQQPHAARRAWSGRAGCRALTR
jgi:hypothetical protein